MHHNNLKYGEIVDDSVTPQSHFVLWKGIGGGLILDLLFRISEYGPGWNHMDIISLEMDSMTP